MSVPVPSEPPETPARTPGVAQERLTAAPEGDRTPGTARSESAAEWQPGDPLYADAPERGHCLSAGCGTTWPPGGATTCPQCGGPAGEPAVFGDPLCVLDESNDMEAFAALPECERCGGTGKQIPDDFWGGSETGGGDV